MQPRQLVKPFLIGLLVFSAAVLLALKVSAHPQGGNPALLNASAEDIKEAALKYTYTRFQVFNDDAAVILIRPVTKEQLPLPGLPEVDFGGEAPPLRLVALKGDFDVRGLRHPSAGDAPWRVTYIVYLFDLKAGAPALTYVSPDGAGLGELLNDPSLPEKQEPPGSPEEGAATPVPPPAHKLPYGALEPSAPTPGSIPETEP